MVRQIFWLLAITLVLVAPAFGQIEVGEVKPGNIRLLEYDRPMVEYLCGGAFIIVVLGVGFKASNRVHDA